MNTRRVKAIDRAMLALIAVFAVNGIVRVCFGGDKTLLLITEYVSTVGLVVLLIVFWLKTNPDKPGKHRDTSNEE